MTYNPNIPAATDLISVSQGQLQTNFQQLNTVYTADHFAYNDATADATKHRRLILPDQAATPPAPGANNGALYANTAAGVTRPFWRRDALAGAPEYSMLGIRAFGAFNGGTGATVTGQNLTSSAFSAVTGFTMTMPASTVSGTTYGVLTTAGVTALNPGVVGFYAIVSATSFRVGFRNTAGTFLAPDFFTVIVIQL